MTTNYVDFIEPEKFIQQVLEESAQTYICHVIMIEDCPPHVHFSRMAPVSATIAQPVTLLKAYKNFENVFYIENAGHLALHKNYDHAIDLINNRQSSYELIYSLSKYELLIVQAYIDKNLTNRFIRSSKSLPVLLFYLSLNLIGPYGYVLIIGVLTILPSKIDISLL